MSKEYVKTPSERLAPYDLSRAKPAITVLSLALAGIFLYGKGRWDGLQEGKSIANGFNEDIQAIPYSATENTDVQQAINTAKAQCEAKNKQATVTTVEATRGFVICEKADLKPSLNR